MSDVWPEPAESDSQIAARWLDVLLPQSGFPDQTALASHLRGAAVTGYSPCGCNSFSLAVDPGAKPLVAPAKNGGLIFEANFMELGSDKSLDILLFVDNSGFASTVEVDYCVNSYPVPERLKIEDTPYHTYTHPDLAPHA